MKVEILIDSFLDAGEKPTISTNFVRKLIPNINLKLGLLFKTKSSQNYISRYTTINYGKNYFKIFRKIKHLVNSKIKYSLFYIFIFYF